MYTYYPERAVYYPERAIYEKIAQAHAAAARDRRAVLAVKANRVGCKTRQTVGSPLARLLRTLASAFGCGRPSAGLSGARPPHTMSTSLK